MAGRVAAAAALVVGALVMSGCVAAGPDNPRFAISDRDLDALWDRMESEPKALDRPVVVIGSYRGPDPIVSSMTRRLGALTSGRADDFVRVPTWFDDEMDEVVARVLAVTADRVGVNAEGTETLEVDVVGLSMGGVVARAAALPGEGRPRLKIRRLFTIASPHRGADLSEKLAPDNAAKAMRPGSAFLAGLDAGYPDREYDLFAYGVLNDGVVGVVNTAPPGELPIWTRGKFWGSHLVVNDNHRILADIALRLRGETPIATPGEPLPDYH